MGTPDGFWEPVMEAFPPESIAIDQYEIAAGVSLVANGLIPTIGFTFRGVSVSDVGNPDAPRREVNVLMQTADVARFAEQAVTATTLRPE